MSLVAGIKSIIFPNKKSWQGFAFIVLHTEKALKELLLRKVATLPITKLEIYIRPNNQKSKGKIPKSKPESKQPKASYVLLDNPEGKFSSKYFLKCALISADLRYLGERKPLGKKTTRQLVFMFGRKKEAEEFIDNQRTIFEEYFAAL